MPENVVTARTVYLHKQVSPRELSSPRHLATWAVNGKRRCHYFVSFWWVKDSIHNVLISYWARYAVSKREWSLQFFWNMALLSSWRSAVAHLVELNSAEVSAFERETYIELLSTAKSRIFSNLRSVTKTSWSLCRYWHFCVILSFLQVVNLMVLVFCSACHVLSIHTSFFVSVISLLTFSSRMLPKLEIWDLKKNVDVSGIWSGPVILSAE